MQLTQVPHQAFFLPHPKASPVPVTALLPASPSERDTWTNSGKKEPPYGKVRTSLTRCHAHTHFHFFKPQADQLPLLSSQWTGSHTLSFNFQPIVRMDGQAHGPLGLPKSTLLGELNLRPPALGAWSFNHWTTREVPPFSLLRTLGIALSPYR